MPKASWLTPWMAVVGVFALTVRAGEAAGPPPGAPLRSEQVVVVANFGFPASVDLARYYLRARGIPPANLLVTGMPLEEHVSRIEYDRYIAEPLRDYLVDESLDHVRCVVLIRGVPLGITDETPRLHAAQSAAASVDSELTTLFWPSFFPEGSLVNPLRGTPSAARRTLMVCRLDGPSPQAVRRIIDHARRAEREGLRGTLYLDARGLADVNHKPRGRGTARYDYELLRLARFLRENTDLSVVLEASPDLFQPGDAPGAALYCGWYRMGHYIDAFDFVPGAVAFHIASVEASTLRTPDSRLWCPALLAHGAAATMGPISEPFLTAFPMAREFFGRLLTGRHTLGECYFMALPHVSWKMTLVGDPLYNPYKNHPVLSPQQLEALLR